MPVVIFITSLSLMPGNTMVKTRLETALLAKYMWVQGRDFIQLAVWAAGSKAFAIVGIFLQEFLQYESLVSVICVILYMLLVSKEEGVESNLATVSESASFSTS
jgi:hypothetical protein